MTVGFPYTFAETDFDEVEIRNRCNMINRFDLMVLVRAVDFVVQELRVLC